MNAARGAAATVAEDARVASRAADAWQTGIRCRKLTDGGPIVALASLREQPQEAVVQETPDRHGNAQRFGRREQQADILVSEGRGEPGRLELALCDQCAVGSVCRRG